MYIIMGNKSPISTSETRIVKGSKCQRCLRTRVNDVSGLYTKEGVVIWSFKGDDQLVVRLSAVVDFDFDIGVSFAHTV